MTATARHWARRAGVILSYLLAAAAAVVAFAMYRTHGLGARIWNGYDGPITNIEWNGTQVIDRIDPSSEAFASAPPVTSESDIEITFTYASTRLGCLLGQYIEPNTNGRIEIALRPASLDGGTTVGVILWYSPIDLLFFDPWPQGSTTVSCTTRK